MFLNTLVISTSNVLEYNSKRSGMQISTSKKTVEKRKLACVLKLGLET